MNLPSVVEYRTRPKIPSFNYIILPITTQMVDDSRGKSTFKANPNYGSFLQDFIKQTIKKKSAIYNRTPPPQQLLIQTMTTLTIPISKTTIVTRKPSVNTYAVKMQMQMDFQKHHANIVKYLQPPKFLEYKLQVDNHKEKPQSRINFLLEALQKRRFRSQKSRNLNPDATTRQFRAITIDHSMIVKGKGKIRPKTSGGEVTNRSFK